MKTPLPILYTPAASAEFAQGYESSDTPPHGLRYFYDAPENGRVSICITEDEAEDFWRIHSIDLDTDCPSPEHFAALLDFTAKQFATGILESLERDQFRQSDAAAIFAHADRVDLLPWVEQKAAPDVAKFHGMILAALTEALPR